MTTPAEEPRKIFFQPPAKDSPGYARRIHRVLQLQELRNSSSIDAAGWETLVKFLADYVVAPSRAEAESLVWDASEEQWNQMLDALATPAGGASEAVPTLSSEPSAAISKAST